MTARDDFDRHLSAWLDANAPPREPEHLLDTVLARTARTRRRPAWLIPERWTFMSAISSQAAAVSRLPWRTVGVLALLLILLAVGAILFVGTRQPALPAPFGLAADGQIAFSSGGDIMVADSPTGPARSILSGEPITSGALGPLFSPDGTHLAFIRGGIGKPGAQLWVAAADGSDARRLADASTVGWVEWSPQSDTIAMLRDDIPDTVSLVEVASGHVTPIAVTGVAAIENVFWRPTDGAQLTFRARDTSGFWGIYLMDRSGEKLRRLALDPGYQNDPDFNADHNYYFQGPSWSADGSRLLYYTLEPAPGSPAGPGFRNHVASVDAAGVVTDDRIVEFDPATDDEFAPAWIGPDEILYQTVEGTEHRMLVGSTAPSHGPGRDLGVTARDWFSMLVAPDAKSVLVTLPGTSGTPDIRSIDLATTNSTPTNFTGDDLSWQRRAP